ncbi:MAG: ribosomal protein S18-alanine N-acetyltransferase [Burkholderiaceae bacterium]
MSAQMKLPMPQREVMFEALVPARLDEVLQIESDSYTFPWSRQNFIDSMDAGYAIQLLVAPAPGNDGDSSSPILGYFVAMRGADEVHLLNLTVAPAYRHQGWAVLLLEGLMLWARRDRAQWLWLEVRGSNLRAQQIYSRYGFACVGIRKNYYPAEDNQREDALIMSLALT